MLEDYKKSWAIEDVVRYFSCNRNKEADLYDSEKYFLNKFMKPGMSVLDFGCAAGGLLNALSGMYGIDEKNYHGVDATPEMIAVARRKFPLAKFYSALEPLLEQNYTFNFVYSFGVLHMILDWRQNIEKLYRLTRNYLVFDLRVSKDGPTIQDINQSYQTLKCFDRQKIAGRVPYVVVSEHEVKATLNAIMDSDDELLEYGYENPVSETVTSPYKKVFMNSCCIVKANRIA